MPLGNLSNVIICRMILLTLQKFMLLQKCMYTLMLFITILQTLSKDCNLAYTHSASDCPMQDRYPHLTDTKLHLHVRMESQLISTIYRIISALCNFRYSTLGYSIPRLEFTQTHLCLKRDNLRHWNSFAQITGPKWGRIKRGRIFPDIQ